MLHQFGGTRCPLQNQSVLPRGTDKTHIASRESPLHPLSLPLRHMKHRDIDHGSTRILTVHHTYLKKVNLDTHDLNRGSAKILTGGLGNLEAQPSLA